MIKFKKLRPDAVIPTLALVVSVAVVILSIGYALNADLRAVQSGEAKLVCFMKDGERPIAPSQVTGFVDGMWLFDNGHASNCKVINGGEL